jgi:uncharacterized protein YggE
MTANTTLPTSRSGLRWLVGGLAVGLLAAALSGPAVTAVQAQSDGDETIRSISITGVGRVKAEPDVADVSLGVTKQGEDAQSAAGEAAITMDAIISALLEAGVAESDIQTTSLTLYPVYDYNENPPDIEGWEASNIVNVTVRDIESVGDVVDAATAAGATNVNGSSFRVDDPAPAEAEARSAAVADARAKADQLAADAGVTIIGVVSISESGAQMPQPIYMERAAFDMDGRACMRTTPVLPGQVKLSSNVFIQYEIESPGETRQRADTHPASDGPGAIPARSSTLRPCVSPSSARNPTTSATWGRLPRAAATSSISSRPG